MDRIHRFIANAGFFGTARTLIVSGAVIVLLACAVHYGVAISAILGTIVAFLLGYILQNPMAQNVTVTKHVMNTIALCVIIALWRFPNAYEIAWVKIFAPIGATLYLSCYFWFLSHPDIVADD